MIYFNTQHQPRDVINSLKKDDSPNEWLQLETDKKEEAKFRVKKAYDVILIPQAQCMAIEVIQVGYAEVLLPEICISVREIVEKKIRAVTDSYNLAFHCTCSQKGTPKSEHLMLVDRSMSPPTHAECISTPLDQQLSKEPHLIWFVSILIKPSNRN